MEVEVIWLWILGSGLLSFQGLEDGFIIDKEGAFPLYLTFLVFGFCYTSCGDMMKVKVFDESHEKDLESAINDFILDFEPDILDIKFSVSTSIFGEEQVYCFSALVVYR